MTPTPDPMKKADASRLETLEALLAEKRKQEGYLAKLEERRAGTPDHVFNRLRDEYLTKLTDAQVRAAAEADALSGGLEDDEAAVAEVERKLATLEEERVELQLRAEVEEWEPREAQKKLTAITAAVSMAEKERDARKAVADRTRALLAEARGGTPAGGSPVVPATPVMRPTSALMAGGPNFDELAFLNAVVGRASTPVPAPAPRDSKSVERPIVEGASAPVPSGLRENLPEPVAPRAALAPTPPPMPAVPAPAPAAPIVEQPSVPVPPSPAPAPASVGVTPAKPEPIDAVQPVLPLDAPAKAPEAAAEHGAGAASAAPTAAAAPTVPAAAAAPVAPPAAPIAAPPAASAPSKPAAEADDEDDDTPSPLGRPTPRTSQAIKTLKCAECGSMNYPTEWYCERCGGELAAL